MFFTCKCKKAEKGERCFLTENGTNFLEMYGLRNWCKKCIVVISYLCL